MTIYVPRDSAARSVGADQVAAAIERATGQPVVRTGSRGMLWLEPLVEVDTPDGRVGYGPVAVDQVDALVASGMTTGAAAGLGLINDLPWMRAQQRLTFERVGLVDPTSPDDHLARGGNVGLQTALASAPDHVVETVIASGLRGRGGAGFPTGIKWRTVLEAESDLKFVCCNADEGDSGTFADRMMMEGDPFALVEGITIAAYAVGAAEGYVYIRSEYPDAIEIMREAIALARARGWLGDGVLGTEFAFDLHVRVGAGAYICGEETSMLESIEGKRGEVRAKPPIPALSGLFDRPTVVNNVMSLAVVPWILTHGGEAYAALGIGRSRGTSVFQLSGNVARGGIFETAFGITLSELVNSHGGGTRSGRPVRAVQVGGPLGAYIPVSQFDLAFDYEEFAAHDAMVGHAGIVVFDDSVDMAEMAQFAMEFCAEESCGKCTPCRIGAVRGVETLEKIRRGEDRASNLQLLDDLCAVMTDGSLCAMGGLTPMPVRSALRHFPQDFTGPSGEIDASAS